MLKYTCCDFGRIMPFCPKRLKCREDKPHIHFDFFEIAIRAVSRGYIPKFLQGGQKYAYD